MVDFVEDELVPTKVMHAEYMLRTKTYSVRTIAYEFLGQFNMGGLNAYPFAGKTGM